MYNILQLNKISENGLSYLPQKDFTVHDQHDTPEGIILRSFSMHDMELPETLTAIARAGAGVNNIPIDKCSEKGIVVFNTPGANANAVKELVIGGLMISSRDVIGGVNWVQTLGGTTDVAKIIEKEKSNYVGPEIMGKKLGVVGLGAIGILVANVAKSLGMEVYGYDPFLSVDSAWAISRGVNKCSSLDEIYTECDYITIHVPYNKNTKNMINTETISKMKNDVRILNFARAELVDNAAIKSALESGKVKCYVTDFPTEEVVGVKNLITIPHLGASTPESEENCAIMAATELREYFLYGNIKNSVNFPDCELAYIGKNRLCIIHKNIANVIGPITSTLASKKINIDNMINKSRNELAYTMIDVDQSELSGVVDELLKIDGVMKVRVI